MSSLENVEAIVIGTSHGGLDALSKLFRALDPDFQIPILVVYHRSKKSEMTFLIHHFSALTTMEVLEIEDNQKIGPGRIYFAPADYHVMVENSTTLSLYLDEPVNFCRPAIDLLFSSAARVFTERVMGVLLTGANDDGAAGLCEIATAGGYTAVQYPQSAEAPYMPQSALQLCRVDFVGSIEQIATIMNEANHRTRGIHAPER